MVAEPDAGVGYPSQKASALLKLAAVLASQRDACYNKVYTSSDIETDRRITRGAVGAQSEIIMQQ